MIINQLKQKLCISVSLNCRQGLKNRTFQCLETAGRALTNIIWQKRLIGRLIVEINCKKRANTWWSPGADLGFSRGGGGGCCCCGFPKKKSNFVYFFVGRANWFSELSQSTKKPCCEQNFSAAGNILKKKAKKAFLGTFWKFLTKKLRFLARSPPLNLVYIGAEGSFRKRDCQPKWISQNSSKGGPFVSSGGRIPEKRGVCPPLPSPKSGRSWLSSTWTFLL